MAAQDRLVVETLELKNEVESYILALRGKLSSESEPYVREEARAKLSQQLEAAEDWLYDEGEDVTKSVYSSKLQVSVDINTLDVRAACELGRSQGFECKVGRPLFHH